MKKFFFLILISFSLFADEALIVDPDFSPFTGASDILFTHWALRNAQDFFRKPIYRDSTLQTWGRAIEIFAWYLINSTADVTQHEVFGHGYRIREFGGKIKGYEITPWGGATFFEIQEDLSIGKFLSITIGGLEAEAILAQKAKFQFMQKGIIDPRIFNLYTQAEQSIFWYTLITHLGRLRGDVPDSGNDVESYLELLNASYPNDEIGIGTLTRWAAFNWLDPMTFFAYASAIRYIALGDFLAFPTIEINENIHFLPNVRIGYAPYGPEAYLENFFSIYSSTFYFYGKGGKRSIGAGLYYDPFYEGKYGNIGIHLDGWWQNQFITDATVEEFANEEDISRSELKNKIFGFAGSLIGKIYFTDSVAFFAEIGGKTKGYLPGYQLSGGIVLRGGFAIGCY